MNREEKSLVVVDILAAQINLEEKKDKTVGFESTNKESIIGRSVDLLLQILF